jgi:hypothetical protein
MGRTDFLLDLARTHNVAAAVTLIVLLVAGRAFVRDRRVGLLVALFALFAAAFAYLLGGING